MCSTTSPDSLSSPPLGDDNTDWSVLSQSVCAWLAAPRFFAILRDEPMDTLIGVNGEPTTEELVFSPKSAGATAWAPLGTTDQMSPDRAAVPIVELLGVNTDVMTRFEGAEDETLLVLPSLPDV